MQLIEETPAKDEASPYRPTRVVTTKANSGFVTRGWLALVDQGIISGTNFVTSFLVGRFLGKDSLGLLFVTVSLFTILQCVTDQLVHTPYLVRAPRMRANKLKRLGGSMFLATVVITLVASLAIAGAGLFVFGSASVPSGLPILLFALAAFLPGMMLRDFVHNMLHNQLRQAEVVILDGAVAVLQLTLMSTFLFLRELSVLESLSIIAFASTLVGAIWLPRLLRGMLIKPKLAVGDFAGNWPIGKWTLGSYLIGSSAPTVLPWILALTHGAEATGLLAACLVLFGISQTFLRGLGKYMAPQLSVAFATGGRSALQASLRSFAMYSLIAMSGIGLVLLLAGEPLVQFVFGSSYVGTAAIMRTLAIGCWLQTLDVLVGNGLLALTLSNRNFWSDCARFGTTVLLALVLIPTLGPLGVALAIVIGMASGLTVRCYQLALMLPQAADEGVGATAPSTAI